MNQQNSAPDLSKVISELKKGNWKIILLPLILCAGIMYFLYVYMPNRQDMNKTDFYYTNYEKAEATILDTYGNGRIGKGQKTLYKIQFVTVKGETIVAEYAQDTFLSKDKGEKIVIYYNPENPYGQTSEESYLEEKRIRDKQANK